MTGPTQPYFPGQFPQRGYYEPAPVHEPLSKRQRRSAAWAGVLGLNLMSLGSGVLSAAIVVGLLAATFAGISSSAGQGSGLQGFDEFLAESDVALWLLAAAAVGVIVLLLGMFVSVAILRTGGVRRPFAVTWSAFGVTVPLLVIMGLIGGVLAQIVVATTTTVASAASAAQGDAPGGSPATTGIVVAIIAYLLSIVVTGIIGWLAWWWMAHVFRERIPAGR